jgi:hypothetical protein
MKTLMLLSTHVLPDPRETLPDKRRRLAVRGKGSRSAVDTAVHRGLERPAAAEPAPSTSGCPHLAALG